MPDQAPDDDIIDVTARDIGTALERVQTQAPANLFHTDDPVEVIEKATRVADALKAVIVAKQLYTMIQNKPHIGVEGWQLVGAMLGVTAVCTHTEPVEGGFKATVEARTADGRVIGSADALCTKHEKRGPWKQADDYARLSMAQTRATSKALKGPLGFVVSLAGYQTTPTEEMTFAESDVPSDVPHGPAPVQQPADRVLTAEERTKVMNAIHLAGVDFDKWEEFRNSLGAASDEALKRSHATLIRGWLDDRGEPTS